MLNHQRLCCVGGFNPSERYESVGIAIPMIPNIWKNKSHVPVTTNHVLIYTYIYIVTYIYIYIYIYIYLNMHIKVMGFSRVYPQKYPKNISPPRCLPYQPRATWGQAKAHSMTCFAGPVSQGFIDTTWRHNGPVVNSWKCRPTDMYVCMYVCM